MKNLAIVIILISIAGCRNHEFEYEYHSNGNIKSKFVRINGKIDGEYFSYDTSEILISVSNWKNNQLDGQMKSYYSDGEIKTISTYKKDTLNGLYKEFYPNNSLKIVGYYINGIKKGNFLFYDKGGNLEASREYIDLNGDSYLNQVIKYNSEGDTLLNESNFFEFTHPDSAEVGDTIELEFYLRAPAIKGSKFFVFLESPDDTSYYRRVLSDSYLLDFTYSVKDTGKLPLKGFIEEFKIYGNPDDSISAASRRLYFQSQMYIK